MSEREDLDRVRPAAKATAPSAAPDDYSLREQAVASLLSGPVPALVTVGGGSMEPSLMRGWTLRVVPIDSAIEPGEIVLLDTGANLIVHRALHRFRAAGRDWLFHRGDGGGESAWIERRRVLGRVTAVLSPAATPFPALDRLPPPILEAFDRAAHRCRVLAALLIVGYRLRLDRLPFGRAMGLLAQKLVRSPPPRQV
jgi:hypothetical protein